MTSRADVLEAEIRSFARWWWLWLVLGIAWIIAGIVILQFDDTSVRWVGRLVGIFLIVAGVEDLVLSSVVKGWKWLWILFGVVLIIGGLWALFNPVDTFVSLADMLGFLFGLVGILWIIESFATKDSNDLWWIGLISGILMFVFAIFTSGQLFVTRAYILLVFAGVWLIMKGIFDIIRSFQIKKLGHIELDNFIPAA